MFNKQQKKSRGFTLIELLVVIAIIGLLAGIVLVSLGGARNSAKDARITSEMSSIRTQGEIYSSDTNTYVGFGASPGITAAVADVNTQNATGDADLSFAEAATAYCAEVQMNDGWYCIDNTFVAKKYTDAAPPSCSAVAPVDTSCD